MAQENDDRPMAPASAACPVIERGDNDGLLWCPSTTGSSVTSTGSLPVTMHVQRFYDANGKELVRSACKARGVAKDHTPESAYILLPQDAKHGHHLMCSHPKCNESGRAFRYCRVCCQVVTKRNFHRRHDHGLLSYSENGRAILPSPEAKEQQPICVPPVVATSNGRSRKLEDLQAPWDDSGGDYGDDEYVTPPTPKRHRAHSSSEALDDTARLEPLAFLAGDTTIGHRGPIVSEDEATSSIIKHHHRPLVAKNQEERAWLKLFRQRPSNPDDPEELSRWFLSVVSSVSSTESSTTRDDHRSAPEENHKRNDDILGAFDPTPLPF